MVLIILIKFGFQISNDECWKVNGRTFNIIFTTIAPQNPENKKLRGPPSNLTWVLLFLYGNICSCPQMKQIWLLLAIVVCCILSIAIRLEPFLSTAGILFFNKVTTQPFFCQKCTSVLSSLTNSLFFHEWRLRILILNLNFETMTKL